MLNTLLSRVLSAPDSPTADLYFRNSCGDMLGTVVDQLAPTVFASQTACLVVRHDRRLRRLPDRRRLIYLIDDDVDAGTNDDSLPFFYRQKLRMVEQEARQRLSRYAGVAVVASPVLARIFRPVMETHLLRPFWSERFAPLDHFDGLGAPGRMIDIAFLGSVVHRSDLQFILPVMARLLATHPNVRFHIPQRHSLPSPFDRHPRVRRIPGIGWTAYRREIAGRRFHIALYPLLETPYNRARSPNKMIEHAVVGAAPVYSASWAEARPVRCGSAAMCVENTADAWFDAVAALVSDVKHMRRVAHGAQKLARDLNSADKQRSLWRRLLDVPESARA